MPITTRWENEHREIIIWEFDGRWTWDDYYSRRDSVNADIASVPHVVHMIVDMRTSNTLPSSAMTHASSAVVQSPRNLGITVIVGVNPVLRSFFGIFSRLYNSLLKNQQINMQMVGTIEEARAIIADYRGTATS